MAGSKGGVCWLDWECKKKKKKKWEGFGAGIKNFEFRCHEAVNLFSPYGKWHLKKLFRRQRNGKNGMLMISYAIIFHNFRYQSTHTRNNNNNDVDGDTLSEKKSESKTFHEPLVKTNCLYIISAILCLVHSKVSTRSNFVVYSIRKVLSMLAKLNFMASDTQ